MQSTGAALKTMYGTSTEKEAVNEFLKTFPPLVQMATVTVQNTLAGKTPYSFQTDPSKFGQSRPHLRDPDSGILASDTEVLAAASGVCYAWDGGAVMPPNLNVLLYGEPSPTDFSTNKSLESVQALGNTMSLGRSLYLTRMELPYVTPKHLALLSSPSICAALTITQA